MILAHARPSTNTVVEQCCNDVEGLHQLKIGDGAVTYDEAVGGWPVSVVAGERHDPDPSLKCFCGQGGGIRPLEADDGVEPSVKSGELEILTGPEVFHQQGPAVRVLPPCPRDVA